MARSRGIDVGPDGVEDFVERAGPAGDQQEADDARVQLPEGDRTPVELDVHVGGERDDPDGRIGEVDDGGPLPGHRRVRPE